MRVAKKQKHLTPEHRIQNDIVAMLRLHRCTVFRGNVGKVRTPDGRFFIEVKTLKGRIRPDQLAFHQDLMHRHAIHGIARSVDDALKIVDEGLVGYGFPDTEENDWY